MDDEFVGEMSDVSAASDDDSFHEDTAIARVDDIRPYLYEPTIDPVAAEERETARKKTAAPGRSWPKSRRSWTTAPSR